MSDYAARSPLPGELQALRELWQTVFGKEGEASFFERLFSEENAVVAEREGRLAAMGYMVPMGELILDTVTLPCAMLYAIAVLPAHRGGGLGAAVVCRLIANAYERGYPAVALCPSEDSLFGYYSSRTGLRDWFYAGEKGISATSTVAGTAGPEKSGRPCHELHEVPPAEYGRLREALLSGVPHVRHNLPYLEYQKALCFELGGGLYQIGDSCAAVEVQRNGAVWVKELLISASDEERNVTSAISAAFPSYEYIFRRPASSGQGRRFGMLAVQAGVPGCVGAFAETSNAPWYGLAFD